MKKLTIILAILLCAGTAWAMRPQFFNVYFGQSAVVPSPGNDSFPYTFPFILE